MPGLLSNLTSLLPSAQSPSPLDPSALVKTYLQGQPSYQVNRERAATVLDSGFRVADTYAKAKPFLFVGGLIGMAVSAVALTKRRRRGAETWIFWSTTFVASAATSWFTRPVPTAQAAPGAPAGTQNTLNVLGIIDARRMQLKAQDPNFADKVFARFDALPSVKAQLDQNPLLKAVAS